jgi:uncharacterized protein (TIGR03086 family)
VSASLRYYTIVMFGLEHTLARVPDDAWDRPSPCAGWTVRDVAGHAMAVTRNIARRAAGRDAPDAFTDLGAIAGDDPVRSFRAFRSEFLESTDRHGSLQRPVTSRLGDMTVDSYLAFMRSDTFVHTWDIARGAEIDPCFEDEIVALVLNDYVERDMTPLRVPGRYDDPMAVPSSADDLARLIAFTGRDPDWMPA